MISDLLDEIQQRETEELRDIKDQNCYAAGYASGVLAAVNEIREAWRGDRIAVPPGCPCDFRYKMAPIVEACRACGREIGSWLACPHAPEHQ